LVNYHFSLLVIIYSMLKSLIKKIMFYDKLYFLLKDSVIYHLRKKFNGQIANAVY